MTTNSVASTSTYESELSFMYVGMMSSDSWGRYWKFGSRSLQPDPRGLETEHPELESDRSGTAPKRRTVKIETQLDQALKGTMVVGA